MSLTPSDDVAVGGTQVAARLGLAFEGVEISSTSRNVVANEKVVMVERTERWTWRTGEQVDLPIASVVEISGSKIAVDRLLGHADAARCGTGLVGGARHAGMEGLNGLPHGGRQTRFRNRYEGNRSRSVVVVDGERVEG